MNHLIHNISVLLIFMGIILLTVNLTKSYNKCPVVVQQRQYVDQNLTNQDRPSKVYNKMFNSPDVWMGYADFDTKNFNSKLR